MSISVSDDTRKELISQCNEIALLLVLAAPGDIDTLKMITEQLEQARAHANGVEPVENVYRGLLITTSGGATQEVLSALSTGITALGQALEQNDLGKISPTPPQSYVEQIVDDRLLAELIETHTLMLEEFESGLMEFINEQSNDEDTKKAAKRYLHNLKGDSGAVGLVGLEKVCHALEDIIGEVSASVAVPYLIEFREWITGYFSHIIDKSTCVATPEIFLARIQSELASSARETPRSAEQKATQPLQATPETSNVVAPYSLAGDLDLFGDFLVEAEEHVTRVEEVCLDSAASFGTELVDAVFRAVHSLKGGSAYFKFYEMTESSHYFENLLVQARDGKRVFDDGMQTLSMQYIDLQKLLLQSARKALQSSSPITVCAEFNAFMKALRSYESQGQVLSATVAAQTQMSQQAAQVVPQEIVPSAKAFDQEGVVRTDTFAGASLSKTSSEEKLEVKSFVKVDTTRLDHLIDSVGEMVIYSAMLVRHCREHLGHNQAAMDASSRVEKFTRDLQDVAMSMRLVPIKGLFQKMSRLVWDTSKKLGKDISFDMEGEDTELDRNLIDKLADPLMHMVRNALDHGVEPPEERIAAGKPRQGKVTLSAFHSGGSIHVVIKDDGRGIDCDRVFAKAVEKGVVSAGAQLSQQDIYQLLFAPGFSTAAKVTDISGRGVGMDVVKRNVESLRGRILISSEKGKGSRFTIELPLTLALIDGIQVQVGDESFIIPSLSIVEFLRPQPGMINTMIHGGETFEFRGDSLPLYRLSHLFGIESKEAHTDDGAVVVLESTGDYVAFFVDDIIGEYSTVIKSLGQLFADQRGLAGCAIMPNGDISLIIDVQSLISFAQDSSRMNVNRRSSLHALELVQ
jgi:two-component system chemotaxis sensor kinase CheA